MAISDLLKAAIENSKPKSRGTAAVALNSIILQQGPPWPDMKLTKDVQSMLLKCGFFKDKNALDGKYGNDTARALVAFESKNRHEPKDLNFDGSQITKAFAESILLRFDQLPSLYTLANLVATDLRTKPLFSEASKKNIRSVQLLLFDLGYGQELGVTDSNVNGIYNDGVRNALIAYAQKNNIETDGDLLTRPLADQLLKDASAFYGRFWRSQMPVPKDQQGLLFKCVKLNNNYGPVYFGKLKLVNYKNWDKLIEEKKLTVADKEILVAMSENEGNLNTVHSYDSEIVTAGAMQKTINPEGKGEFPIQVQAFKNDFPEKYKSLFEELGWTVANKQMFYKDPGNADAAPITGSALKAFIRTGFTSETYKKRLPCKPLDVIVNAISDDDFLARQVMDFINRLDKALSIKVTGTNFTIRDFVKSKLGKATVLDQHINRPGFVKRDFTKAVNHLFATKPDVPKNPAAWGRNQKRNEKIIIEFYGVNRRGWDMPNRYEKMKEKL